MSCAGTALAPVAPMFDVKCLVEFILGTGTITIRECLRLEPHRILEREPELLDIARANMPRLPVDRLDVLVVDRMGKDISGVGIDTNIIGRMRIRGQPEPERPDIAMIVVTDLTDAFVAIPVGAFADPAFPAPTVA